MGTSSVRILAALALAAAAVPALAGSPFADSGRPERLERGERAAPPSRRGPAGLFDCSFRERRTKLERKNCGTIRP